MLEEPGRIFALAPALRQVFGAGSAKTEGVENRRPPLDLGSQVGHVFGPVRVGFRVAVGIAIRSSVVPRRWKARSLTAFSVRSK